MTVEYSRSVVPIRAEGNTEYARFFSDIANNLRVGAFVVNNEDVTVAFIDPPGPIYRKNYSGRPELAMAVITREIFADSLMEEVMKATAMAKHPTARGRGRTR